MGEGGILGVHLIRLLTLILVPERGVPRRVTLRTQIINGKLPLQLSLPHRS